MSTGVFVTIVACGGVTLRTSRRQTRLNDDTKPPWYIDLLNINLDNHDLDVAVTRIERHIDAFRTDGTRLTESTDFSPLPPTSPPLPPRSS